MKSDKISNLVLINELQHSCRYLSNSNIFVCVKNTHTHTSLMNFNCSCLTREQTLVLNIQSFSIHVKTSQTILIIII